MQCAIGLCVSRSPSETSIPQTVEKLESNHTFKLCKGTWHHIKIRERKGPSRGVDQKCEPHERNPCAPTFEARTRDETLQQERCARRVAWDLAKKCLQASKIRIRPHSTLLSKHG